MNKQLKETILNYVKSEFAKGEIEFNREEMEIEVEKVCDYGEIKTLREFIAFQNGMVYAHQLNYEFGKELDNE